MPHMASTRENTRLTAGTRQPISRVPYKSCAPWVLPACTRLMFWRFLASLFFNSEKFQNDSRSFMFTIWIVFHPDKTPLESSQRRRSRGSNVIGSSPKTMRVSVERAHPHACVPNICMEGSCDFYIPNTTLWCGNCLINMTVPQKGSTPKVLVQRRWWGILRRCAQTWSSMSP